MPNATASDTPALEALVGRAPLQLALRLQPAATKAYVALRRAAKQDGIELFCVSGYRSFRHQQQIWQRKAEQLLGEGLTPEQALDYMLVYSAPPGLSRHHWATEVDLIADIEAPWPEDPLLPKWFHDGPFVVLREWLEANVARFDFHLTYSNDSERTGHAYEPWHYSYLPLSEIYVTTMMEVPITTLHRAVFNGDWSAGSEALAQIEGLLDEAWLEHYRTSYIASVS